MLDERAALQFCHGLPQLRLCVHNDRTVPRYRLLDRLAGHQEKTDAFLAGLNGNLIATIEQNERVIPGVVLRVGARIDSRFGQNRARIRCIPERARTGEDVGKSVTCSLDLQPLASIRSNRDINLARIGRYSFDRSPLSPELSANHPDSCAVIVRDHRDRTRWDVLIARVRHLQARGQIRPQLEAVHPAVAVAFWHFLVENAASSCHPLHVASGHFSFIAQAVTVLDRPGQNVGDGFDAAVWMPGKSGAVIVRIIVTEIVQ